MTETILITILGSIMIAGQACICTDLAIVFCIN